MNNYTLSQISHYAGMREDLAQAGGGNTSVKENETRMLIKASGFQLSEVTETEGFSVVNPKVIVDFFENTPLEKIGKADEKPLLEKSLIEGKRPSIETFLHSITDKVTIHSHPVMVGALACRKGGMEEIKSLFPESITVPYATPGIELAKEYFKAWKSSGGKTASVVFMQNHGLLVSAATADEAISLNESVVSKIAEHLGIDNSSCSACTEIWRVLQEAGVEGVAVLVNDRRVYAALEELGGAWDFAVCPDCIVYCGKKALELKDGFSANDISEFTGKHGKPYVVFYRNNFYAIAPTVKKAKEIESLLAFSAQIAVRNKGKETNCLADEEQNFLLNWDAEKYRRNMK